MNTEIKMSPEELRGQANRLAMLSCRMQDVSNKAKATMQSMAVSVTPDFACNLDWKGNMLASKLDVLATGLQYGGTRATFAANALEAADINAGKDNCAILEMLSVDNINERSEGIHQNVLINIRDVVLEDTKAGLFYETYLDIANGEVDADTVFTVFDGLAGNNSSARIIFEALESAHDHTIDYAIYHSETVSDWNNGDYVDAIFRDAGRFSSQVGITLLDAVGSTIMGYADSATILPGLTVGDVSEFFFGDSFSSLYDKGMEEAREITQEFFDKGGEFLQDCFDDTVSVVKDTFDNVGDGLSNIGKSIGDFFGL